MLVQEHSTVMSKFIKKYLTQCMSTQFKVKEIKEIKHSKYFFDKNNSDFDYYKNFVRIPQYN